MNEADYHMLIAVLRDALEVARAVIVSGTTLERANALREINAALAKAAP